MSKKEAVAHILNQTFEELISRATKDYGVGDYADIAVIGYGQNSNKANFIKLGQQSNAWITLSELKKATKTKTIQVQTKQRGGILKTQEMSLHWWIDPVAAYQTPMRSALNQATDLLKEWVAKNPNSYPPTVINITDGDATDATTEELQEAAQALKNVATNDGNVLLFNCHIEEGIGDSIYFPVSEEDLPDDEYARILFRMSSILPEIYHPFIKQLKGSDTAAPYVALGYKAGAAELVNMIDMGTRTIKPAKS